MSKIIGRSWCISQQCERRPSPILFSRHSFNFHSRGTYSRSVVAAQNYHSRSQSYEKRRDRRRCSSRSSSQNAFPSLPSRVAQTKSFSTTTPAQVGGGTSRIVTTANKNKSGKAMGLLRAESMAKMMRSGDIPDDLGLLPQTFVPPTGQNQPGWWKAPRGQWQLMRRGLTSWIMDHVRAKYFRWFAVKPRPKLDRSRVKKIAADLHQEMYRHFASGNLEPIHHKLCSGLYNNLSGRIQDRRSSGPMRWTLHKYISKPKLVSYKATVMPLSPDPVDQYKIDAKNAFGLVQAVVRLHSLQSLHHVKRIAVQPSAENNGGSMKEIAIDPSSGKEIAPDQVEDGAKEVVEYVVVQQQLKRSQLQEWMMWGMTNETTLQRLKQETDDKAAVEKKVRKQTRSGAAAQPS